MKTFLIIVGVIILLITLFILYLFFSNWLDEKKKEKEKLRALKARKMPILGIVSFGRNTSEVMLIVAIDEGTLHKQDATPISVKVAGSKWGYKKASIQSAWHKLLSQFPKGKKHLVITK